jgi:hypothetical protein
MKCCTPAGRIRPVDGMNPIDGPDKPSPPRIEQPKLIQSCPAPAGDPLPGQLGGKAEPGSGECGDLSGWQARKITEKPEPVAPSPARKQGF